MADPPEDFNDLFDPVTGVETTAPPGPPPTVACPSCGTANVATARHCVACGARVAQGPLPMAPQPLIRTTAGSRALVVTAVVIAIVAVAAFIFNAFGGDDETTPGGTTANGSGTETTTAGSTGSTVPPPGVETVKVVPNRVVPSAQLSDFPASNLIDNDPLTMWQVGQEGVGATVTFFFEQPVSLERIEFLNLADPEGFRRNFRIRDIRIIPDDTTRAVVTALQDIQELQVIPIQTTSTLSLRIEVTSTFPAEAVGDLSPFKELAIQDIAFFGQVVGG